MKIIVASESEKRIKAITEKFPNDEVCQVITDARIGDVAFDSGLFNGAYNKIKFGVLGNEQFKDDDWDMVISLQSGLVSSGKDYYFTEVCMVLDKNGLRVSNGPMIKISRNVYDSVGLGYDIYDLIDKKWDNTTSVISFLSEGILNRTKFTGRAVRSALNSEYKQISQIGYNFDSVLDCDNENTRRLDAKCAKIMRDYKLYGKLPSDNNDDDDEPIK